MGKLLREVIEREKWEKQGQGDSSSLWWARCCGEVASGRVVVVGKCPITAELLAGVVNVLCC